MTEAPAEGASVPQEATTAKPKKAAAKVDQTGYVVLAKQEATAEQDVPVSGEWGWSIVGMNITARSSEHAVRIYAEKLGADQKDIVLVAVPVRSWRPVKVTAKVTTALILQDAS